MTNRAQCALRIVPPASWQTRVAAVFDECAFFHSDEELETAFAALISAHVGALLVTADPYFDTRREQIVAFAARQRLPSIYQFREYAVAGGLLSYGVSITDAYRNCGVYTAKILKGAKPADLPVLQPTKFE